MRANRWWMITGNINLKKPNTHSQTNNKKKKKKINLKMQKKKTLKTFFI